MCNSRRSGTAKAAELLLSQLTEESGFMRPAKVRSRAWRKGFGMGGKHPNCFTFPKDHESTTSSHSLQDWTLLHCILAVLGLPNTDQPQRALGSILIHCALPTERDRMGGEKNGAVITPKPSLSTSAHHLLPFPAPAACRNQSTASLWR